MSLFAHALSIAIPPAFSILLLNILPSLSYICMDAQDYGDGKQHDGTKNIIMENKMSHSSEVVSE